MKQIDILKTAVLNIKSNKVMTKKIEGGFVIIFIFFICFFSLCKSYDNYKAEFNSKHRKECFYYKNISLDEFNEQSIEEIKKEGENERRQYFADSVLTILSIDSKRENETYCAYNTFIEIKNKKYKAKYSEVTVKKNIEETIDNRFSTIDLVLFKKSIDIVPNFCKEKIVGEKPDCQGEIMLDDYIVKVYGLNEEEIIGKTISIINKDMGEYIIKDYRVSGILDSSVLRDRESGNVDGHYEHIFVNLKKDDYQKFRINYGSIRCYFKNYTEYMQNNRNSENLIKLELQESNNQELMKMNLTPKGMEYSIMYYIMNSIGKVLVWLGMICCLVVVLSMVYLLNYFWLRQKTYRTMLQNIGIEPTDLYWLRVYEVSLMVAKSIILASYFSLIILMLLNYVTTKFCNFTIVLW